MDCAVAGIVTVPAGRVDEGCAGRRAARARHILCRRRPAGRPWAPSAVGDHLFDENGRPCRVTGVSEVMTGHPCYRLAFDDREQVVADGSHRWPVWDFTDDIPVRKVLRTDEMLGRLKIRQEQALPLRGRLLPPGGTAGPGPDHTSLRAGGMAGRRLVGHEPPQRPRRRRGDCRAPARPAASMSSSGFPRWRKGKCANVVIDPTFRTSER